MGKNLDSGVGQATERHAGWANLSYEAGSQAGCIRDGIARKLSARDGGPYKRLLESVDDSKNTHTAHPSDPTTLFDYQASFKTASVCIGAVPAQ